LLDKKEIKNLLESLAGEYAVVAPVSRGDHSMFAELREGDEPCLDFLNTKKSVKEQFLPQREQLFTFTGSDIREPSFSGKKKIIFGVRPCDARSLAILDHVFNGKDYQDPYYLDSRRKSIVISIGCSQPESTCFCTAMGGDPFAAEGSDVLLCDTGEQYLVQAVSEKGKAFVEKQAAFKKADEKQTRQRDAAVSKSREAVTTALKKETIKQKLDKHYDNPFWAKLHEKCLGCGVCTFLCPTCHCFDILDETKGASGERIRIWDSCMFPLFTLHASGANPRPSGKERMRQRVMHKFKYYVDNNGCVACTGCGRCIRYCPVNMDIRDVLKQIEEL